MTRGVLIYAHNNTEIDYLKIACANALMVRYNLKVSVTLVTDAGTIKWGREELGDDFINMCFDNVIETNRDYSFVNERTYFDTSFSNKTLQFYNCNHWQAFDLSPYDETLFIDCDYLIMSDQLNRCWGSVNDVMINYNTYSPVGEGAPAYKNVDELGIKLYWATVIYFKKSSLAEHMFSIVRHVQENYKYYKDLYYFNSGMFRNDNAFSIAVHTINGFSERVPLIKQLPIPGLIMAWDTSDIQRINGINDITLYVEKDNEKGNYILARYKNTDIHIMNKWAINRHSQDLINLYTPKK